jgi:hypothetical protein
MAKEPGLEPLTSKTGVSDGDLATLIKGFRGMLALRDQDDANLSNAYQTPGWRDRNNAWLEMWRLKQNALRRSE